MEKLNGKIEFREKEKKNKEQRKFNFIWIILVKVIYFIVKSFLKVRIDIGIDIIFQKLMETINMLMIYIFLNPESYYFIKMKLINEHS